MIGFNNQWRDTFGIGRVVRAFMGAARFVIEVDSLFLLLVGSSFVSWCSAFGVHPRLRLVCRAPCVRR